MPNTPEYNQQYRQDHLKDIEAKRRERRRAGKVLKIKTLPSPETIEARKVKKATQDKAYRQSHVKEIRERLRTPEKRYLTSKTDAKRRGYCFELSFESWWTEAQRLCYYCQDQLGKRSETTVGLDRINNALGYIEGNIVSCCEFCNLTKNDRISAEEMLQIANLLIKMRKIAK